MVKKGAFTSPITSPTSPKISSMEAVNIYPILMTWKVNRKGQMPLALSFDFQNKRVVMRSLGHKLPAELWDERIRKVNKNHPNADLLNSLIEVEVKKHEAYFLKRRLLDLPVTRDFIKEYAKGNDQSDFLAYAEHVIENKKLRDGGGYDPDTKRRYRDEIVRLKEFQDTVPFAQMTPQFLEKYKVWMQVTYRKKDGTKMHPNSIWKAFSFLRMVFNYAIEKEVIVRDHNPFKSFKVGSYEEDVDKIKYLELPQIEAIEQLLNNAPATLDALAIRVGWRFLAMCTCGLRISDAMYLDDCYFNDRGDLEFTPHKTRRYGNRAYIPITSERQRRYLGITTQYKLSEMGTDHKSFRTTFNNKLKVIGALAGIDVNLTSHVGRHTMGSFLVDAGVETKAGKAILGIKSDRTLETYRHLKQSKLRSEADKLQAVM